MWDMSGFGNVAGILASTQLLTRSWTVPDDYDFRQSTEDNYAVECCALGYVGRFDEGRGLLDHTWHAVYSAERQRFQDALVEVSLAASLRISRPTARPWVVFTAGAMGAGKSRTIKWLSKRDLFPLKNTLVVDPDRLRYHLPEMAGYMQINSAEAGRLTNKEAGLLCELLVHSALDAQRNVLFDSSLRNAAWVKNYFRQLRSSFPNVRIAIVHVFAPPRICASRAVARAAMTGRHVPADELADSLVRCPRSVESLTPLADVVVHFSSEGKVPELKIPAEMSLADFSRMWEWPVDSRL